MIDENYRVKSDPRNFILEKLTVVTDKKTQESKQEWRTQGYFGKFDHLLKYYLNECIRDSENADISKLYNLINDTYMKIEARAKKENITYDGN